MNIKIYRWEIIDDLKLFSDEEIVEDDYEWNSHLQQFEWKLIHDGDSLEEALFVLFQERINNNDVKIIWRTVE